MINIFRVLFCGNFAQRCNLFLELVNRTFAVCCLGKYFYLGKSIFFSIDPHEKKENAEIPVSHFDISIETDTAVIPQLMECMAGSTDYNYLTEEQIKNKFNKLLNSGSKVCIARDNEQIAGFFWLTTKNYTAPCGTQFIEIKLKDEQAVIEFIFVNVLFRRKHIYSELFRQIYNCNPQVSFSCIVDSYNLPSIKAQLKLGFKRSGSLTYFRCFSTTYASLRFGKIRRILFRV